MSTDTFLVRNYAPFHTCCFRKEMIAKLLPMPEQRVFMYDAWAALVCSLSAPIGYIDECLVHYRQHQSNMVGAGVLDARFYVKQLNDPAFVRHYVEDKSCQMSIHKRLLAMDPGDVARKALKNKIDNQTVLLAAMQATKRGEFFFRMLKAAWQILKTSQRYHMKQWLFFALSWDGIKKANVQNQIAERCGIGPV